MTWEQGLLAFNSALGLLVLLMTVARRWGQIEAKSEDDDGDKPTLGELNRRFNSHIDEWKTNRQTWHNRIETLADKMTQLELRRSEREQLFVDLKMMVEEFRRRRTD